MNRPFKRLIAQEAFVIGHAWHPRLNSFHAHGVFLEEKTPDPENASAQRFRATGHNIDWPPSGLQPLYRLQHIRGFERSGRQVSVVTPKSRGLRRTCFHSGPDGTSSFKFIRSLLRF
jgi:hypothetical protein